MISGGALSEDDEFNSNSVAGVLGWKIPSLMTLFGRTYDDFNGKIMPNGKSGTNYYNFIISLFNAEDGTDL